MPDKPGASSRDVLVIAAKGKRIIAAVLLALMFLVVAVGTVELVFVVISELLSSLDVREGYFVLSEEGLLAIFGLFLNVLIAVELIETVEVYFREHSLHAETVVLVAIIAVARKAILLDLGAYEPLTIFALSALIIVLGVVYYLVKRVSVERAAA